MKKVILMSVVAVCWIGMMGQSWAQTTDTIAVTVSLQSEISVSVSPASWNLGPVALAATAGPQAATATVGNTTTALEILGANGAGGWMIGATAGADQFRVAVPSPALNLSTSYQELDAGVAPYGSKVFDLTYYSPTSDTKGAGENQGFDITVKASAP